MLNTIDLSHTLTDQMPVYPGDALPHLRQVNSFEKDGFNNFRLSSGMHTGTHIDGPMHLTTSDTYLNEISLDRFTGHGCFLNAAGWKDIPLTAEYESLVQRDSIVMLYTGMSRLFGRKEYFQDYPTVSKELAQLFVDRRVKMMCLDSPSPDRHPYEIHKLLLEHHVLIAENLTRLDLLQSLHTFEVIALPLNIRADSSPARIIARFPGDQQ
ncbi:MAG: cyclase family protein [Ignavibacteriae bacterium]|nr:MAG: cyclase family protein [Ignavibacteriota bacterium]